MLFEKPLKAWDNDEWWTRDEYGNVILTDIAPVDVIIDYNNRQYYSEMYSGKDMYIHPEQFREMRLRIGYDEEKIIKEMKEIYTTEEFVRWETSKQVES